jgi:H+/Cl- antiporter ClcA
MDMDYGFIVPLLALLTLLAVCIFALVSKVRTEARRHDPTAPKSSLAKDSPSGGPFSPES